ncbi:MAG: alkaline phosphatase family protein, partial [Peptococcaceae bacterium]|nr:alkaline phosphatase family protein [Peptococcaceae bacterium]
GSSVKLYVSAAMDIHNDKFYHPHELYTMLNENAGYCPPTAAIHIQDMDLHNAQFDCWDHVIDWYVKGLHYMMDEAGFEVIFSHMHNVDMCDHTFISHLADKGANKYDVAVYEQWLRELYVQTDRYIGEFLKYIDEGWSIIITSDHGLSCCENQPVGIGCMSGMNVEVLEQLGYTTMIRNEQGYPIAVDWSKTKAVATQANNIYINLKGRQLNGIVEPEDKYELEEQIMTDLYGFKHPITGKRVIALALRNKDAVLVGYGGENCGDICYFMAENYANDHCDGLATACGVYDTTQSPIFLAAGKGFKKGYVTDRIIREVDVAPTVAVLAGVRMPAQCEGAPVYQILE